MDLSKNAAQLIRHEDYREFLKEALGTLGFNGQRINYAAFARKAGFASRSFPRDVIVGKRQITAQTLPQFIRGMGITGDLKSYFSLLAMQGNPDLNTQQLSEDQIRLQLKKIRQKIRTKPTVRPQALQIVAKYRYWQEIFASLGDSEVGALATEVQERTQLSLATCKSILHQMVEQNCAEFLPQTQRYRSLALHLNLEGLGQSDFFKSHLQTKLRKINQRLETDLSSEQCLFFDSVWSIPRHRFPELKQQLRQLISQFIESTEDSEGMALANLFVALGPSQPEKG